MAATWCDNRGRPIRPAFHGARQIRCLVSKEAKAIVTRLGGIVESEILFQASAKIQ